MRYTLGNVVRDLRYDEADRIKSYTHFAATTGAPQPPLDQSFGYDALGRLTNVTANGSSWTIGYDANGNRTGVTLNGVARTYTTATTSNRLSGISNPARTLQYDNAGNTTQDTERGYTTTYDLSNRMATLSKGGVTTTYTYDGLGRRVRKVSSTGAASTTLFVYGQEGQLLGEYDSTGKAIREYVWLGSTPVAIFTPDAANAANPPIAYYVHTDHLDTPRTVVDRNDKRRWRWLAEPFGTTAPETNPEGLGAFTQNLRFPGQYADQESGLFYNYFRDYDAGTGRYVQSDPIGLKGGINTFAYVSGNPVSYIDPTGEYGWRGALAGGAFNFSLQYGANLLQSDFEWKRSFRCVNWTDVGISGGVGAIAPGFWGQVVRGRSGPMGYSWGVEAFNWTARALPAGYSIKKVMPDYRISTDECECKDMDIGKYLGEIFH